MDYLMYEGKNNENLKAALESCVEKLPEAMERYFQTMGDCYDTAIAKFGPAYERVASLLTEKTDSVLSVGCGSGPELEAIFNRFPDCYVTAVDLSRELLAHLEDRYFKRNLEVVRADFFRRPYPKHNYDAIILPFSMHYYDGKRKRFFFERLLTALKPGGELFLVDWYAKDDAEEALWKATSDLIRERWNLKDAPVQVNQPITVEHEIRTLRLSRYENVVQMCTCNGATLICAKAPTVPV